MFLKIERITWSLIIGVVSIYFFSAPLQLIELLTIKTEKFSPGISIILASFVAWLVFRSWRSENNRKWIRSMGSVCIILILFALIGMIAVVRFYQ